MKYEKLALEQYRELTKLHKAAYQAWDKTKAIYIKYAGTQISATAQVKASTLELAAPAGSVVYDINLAASAYDTLAELVAYIDSLAAWECSLGNQYEGSELSTNLAEIGATSVLTGIWFAHDTQLQIKIAIPAVTGKKISLTKIIGGSTYASGTSKMRVYDGSNLVWEENASASTIEKEFYLPKLDLTLNNACILKILNSADMTAGQLAVAYEEKYAVELKI